MMVKGFATLCVTMDIDARFTVVVFTKPFARASLSQNPSAKSCTNQKKKSRNQLHITHQRLLFLIHFFFLALSFSIDFPWALFLIVNFGGNVLMHVIRIKIAGNFVAVLFIVTRFIYLYIAIIVINFVLVILFYSILFTIIARQSSRIYLPQKCFNCDLLSPTNLHCCRRILRNFKPDHQFEMNSREICCCVRIYWNAWDSPNDH